VSYYRRDGRRSRFLVDRLPIYVFPAFIGSGRMLLGVALTAVTTAILMHTGAAGEPLYIWLAALAYASGLWLVISGIYAVNVVPTRGRSGARLPEEPVHRLPSRQPFAGSLPSPPPPELPLPSSRLGDLLVDQWRLLTPEQLDRALRQQQASERSLVSILAEGGILTDEQFERILEVQSASLDPWHDTPRHG